MTTYHRGRALAIAAGVVATAGALAILLADPITTHHWRLDHAIIPAVVFLTIASGHLTGDALSARRYLSAAGFALLFTAGTLLTVYSSVGSQHAASGDQAADATSRNQQIADKRADLDRARQRFDQAETMATREMTGSRCGQRCDDWKRRAREVAALVRQIEAELATLGGPRTLAPKPQAFAAAAAEFGFDAKTTARRAALLEPFARSLVLEIAAIVAFGYGFGGKRRRPSFADSAQTSFAGSADPATFAGTLAGDEPEPPKPRRRRPAPGTGVAGGNRNDRLPANVVPIRRDHPVLAAIDRAGGQVASNRDLARMMGVTDGEATKRRAEIEHLLITTRAGKQKQIRRA